MEEVVKFEYLSRDEQISFFINQVSGNEKADEIFNMISMFAAYNLNDETYLKWFDEYDNTEIADNLNNCMVNGEYDEEHKAWNIIIDTLGSEKIFDIIENICNYMKSYLKFKLPLEDMENMLVRAFTRI